MDTVWTHLMDCVTTRHDVDGLDRVEQVLEAYGAVARHGVLDADVRVAQLDRVAAVARVT